MTTTPALCSSDLAAVAAQCPGASPSIVAESPYRYRVDRRALSGVLNVPKARALLLATPRIIPALNHHHSSGFRIYAIPPGSLAARLGLRNGDTVHSVNGMTVQNEVDDLDRCVHDAKPLGHLRKCIAEELVVTLEYDLRLALGALDSLGAHLY